MSEESFDDLPTSLEISIPTSVTAKKYLDIQNKEDIKKHVNAKLSGPVAAYSGIYDNNNYYFFGDIHWSRTNECILPCKSINSDGKYGNFPGSKSCWDMARLLADIFDRAEAKGEYVDFYLEIPFIRKNKYRPTKEQVKKSSKHVGNLYNLYHIFYDCFNKNNCKWKNVRFHYIETRAQFTDVPGGSPDIYALVFEKYVINRINNVILMLKGKKKLDDTYIKNTNILVKYVYNNPEPLNVLLFKLYLISDNYTEDVRNATEDMMNLLYTDDENMDKNNISNILYNDDLIVNRRGKNMHRTRAQLEALEQEGQGELAHKIISYVWDSYIKHTDNESVGIMWNTIMNGYEIRIENPQSFKNLISEITKLNSRALKRNEVIYLVMDIYVLARMFRSFPDTNHIDSKTKIIYSGVDHSQTYVNFFRDVLDTEFNAYGEYNLYPTYLGYLFSTNRCIGVNINDFLK